MPSYNHDPGSLQALLGRNTRGSGIKRPPEGSESAGSGSTSVGGGRAAASSQQTQAPLQRQGDIKSFFTPQPKRQRAEAATGEATAAAAAAASRGSSPGLPRPPAHVPADARQPSPSCDAASTVDDERSPSAPAPPPAAAAAEDGRWSLETAVVGRQYQGSAGRGHHLTPASLLALRREPQNSVDPNAIQVVVLPSEPAAAAAAPPAPPTPLLEAGSASGVTLGHLPAPVARHLAPLLDGGKVAVRGVVLVAGTAGTVSITLSLEGHKQQQQSASQAGSQEWRPGGGADDDPATDEAVAVLQEAAAGGEPGRGTGQILVEGFRMMAERIRWGPARPADACTCAAWPLLCTPRLHQHPRSLRPCTCFKTRTNPSGGATGTSSAPLRPPSSTPSPPCPPTPSPAPSACCSASASGTRSQAPTSTALRTPPRRRPRSWWRRARR
jgi:hypothetical protein